MTQLTPEAHGILDSLSEIIVQVLKITARVEKMYAIHAHVIRNAEGAVVEAFRGPASECPVCKEGYGSEEAQP